MRHVHTYSIPLGGDGGHTGQHLPGGATGLEQGGAAHRTSLQSYKYTMIQAQDILQCCVV